MTVERLAVDEKCVDELLTESRVEESNSYVISGLGRHVAAEVKKYRSRDISRWIFSKMVHSYGRGKVGKRVERSYFMGLVLYVGY
jgi:hypothetical protein